MTSKSSQVPVYVPTEGEVVQEAYIIGPTVVPEVSGMTVTDDMIKTYSLARTIKILTIISFYSPLQSPKVSHTWPLPGTQK